MINSETESSYFKEKASIFGEKKDFFFYKNWCKNNKLYELDNGNLGRIYKIPLIQIENLSDVEIKKNIDYIRNFYDLDERILVQIHFYADLDKGEALKKNENQRADKKILKNAFNSGIEHLKKSSNAVKRSLWISLIYQRQEKKSLISYLLPLESEIESLDKDRVEFLEKLNEFEHTCPNNNYSIVAPNELLERLRSKCNPNYIDEKDKYPPISEDKKLSHQISYSDFRAKEDEIKVENRVYKVLNFANYPVFSASGMISELLEVDFPLELTFNIKKIGVDTGKIHIKKKQFLTFSKKSFDLGEKAKEEAGEKGSFFVIPTIKIWGKSSEEIKKKYHLLKEKFSNKIGGIYLREETLLASEHFFHSLPMAAVNGMELLPTAQFYNSEQINDLIPYFDSTRGSLKPHSYFKTREHSYAGIDLYEGSKAAHTIYLGNTRTGKNALAEKIYRDLILQEDALVFVLDVTSNMQTVSKLLNGEYIKYEFNKRLPISPFTFHGTYDPQKVEFSTNFIMAIIAQYNTNFEFDSIYTQIISLSIKKALITVGGRIYENHDLGSLSGEDYPIEIDLDDIIYAMNEIEGQEDDESKSEFYSNLRIKLEPFYDNNIYSDFFKSNSIKRDFTKNITYYDLSALASNSTIEPLISMALLDDIRQVKSLKINKKKKVIILITEVGVLGDNNIIANWLEKMAETAAKENIAIHGISPTPDNFIQKLGAKTLAKQSKNFIFLESSGQSLSTIKENFKFLSPVHHQIIESLRIKLGKSTQFMLVSNNTEKFGVYEFPMSPIDYWLSPNNEESQEKIKEELKKRKDITSTLNYLIENYPTGL